MVVAVSTLHPADPLIFAMVSAILDCGRIRAGRVSFRRGERQRLIPWWRCGTSNALFRGCMIGTIPMPLRCNSSEHIIGLIAGFSPLHTSDLSVQNYVIPVATQPPPVFTRPVEGTFENYPYSADRDIALSQTSAAHLPRQRTVTCCYASLESMNMRSCALLETN